MWPFESAKAISAAVTVLNEYANEVTTLNKDKLWRMLWQYTAIHTPLWKITNCTDGTYLDVAKNCAAGGTGSIPTCCYGGHSLSRFVSPFLLSSLARSLAPSLPPSFLCVFPWPPRWPLGAAAGRQTHTTRLAFVPCASATFYSHPLIPSYN